MRRLSENLPRARGRTSVEPVTDDTDLEDLMTRTAHARTRRTIAAVAGTALGAGLLIAAAPASSAASGIEREKHGSCTNQSRWELQLEREHGQVEVDFEADTTSTGATWKVKVKHNGKVDYKGKRVSDRDGEFEVDRLLADKRGKDKVVVRAKNTATGEICKAKLKI